ncbi:MAG TPA: helix-turn-helix domain-containing protein [Mycobacteriales bacterium]|nr:helix-turn-helix domain-containing protein [Mycobacteriales bacterium]
MPDTSAPSGDNHELSSTTEPAGWPITPVDLLRPEDVAHRLQIGRTKVYDLIRSGTLRSVKVGGCRRVTLAALAEFIARLDGRSAA